MSADARRAGAFLTIDLEAIVSNWRQLAALGSADCGAVVKADAYGLGAAPVAAALREAGCRTFFVAHLEEGIALRQALGDRSRIFVLNGTPSGTEQEFREAALTPVVNTLGELSGWRSHAGMLGQLLPVALQVDTGMSRLGLPPSDLDAIADDRALLEGISVELLMSHLACADEPGHPANVAQREAFERLRSKLPGNVPASLANSSGAFLGEAFHFDLLRPGAALYGINPTPHLKNPMRQVVRLCSRVIQTREVSEGTGVGYGHRARAGRPSLLATLSIGYADGWPRNAAASAFFRDQRLPFVGRVSMDSIVLDATDCAKAPREGDLADLICPSQSVDEVAAAAGTIGYEILTRLGRRFHRTYLGPASVPD